MELKIGKGGAEMGSVNKVLRLKELITQISKANEAYYRDDSPIKKVSGSNREEFKKVIHTKRMLSQCEAAG